MAGSAGLYIKNRQSHRQPAQPPAPAQQSGRSASSGLSSRATDDQPQQQISRASRQRRPASAQNLLSNGWSSVGSSRSSSGQPAYRHLPRLQKTRASIAGQGGQVANGDYATGQHQQILSRLQQRQRERRHGSASSRARPILPALSLILPPAQQIL